MSYLCIVHWFILETLLSSLYVDEQALTRDHVILPRDFLNFNLQRHIKVSGRIENIDRRLFFCVKQTSNDLCLGKEDSSSKEVQPASTLETEEKDKLVIS